MKFIKLMPDYNCHPLWHHKGKDVGDINPNSLPLSKELIYSIEQWAKTYDTTLNTEYPPESAFVSGNEEQSFVDKGFLLAKQLQTELGSDYKVVYYHILLNTIVDTSL